MSIISSELKFYKSKVVTDTTANGGRMSADVVTSGAQQNVFPHAFSAERVAGSTKYRKVFSKVANDSDLTLYSPQVWLDIVTPGDDYVYFHIGTQRDTQNDITGSERKYGCGTLNTTVTAGGSTVIVDVEVAAIAAAIFQNGDTIRITDMALPDSVTGNAETHVINGAPSVVDTVVTITLTGTLANGYTAGTGTRIMSVYEPADLATSTSDWVETSTSGTYDETTYPLVLDNIGTVDETWTLTFSDATNFTVVGDSLGSVGSGTVGGDFAPNNSDSTKPYFTLALLGWGGTWAVGETIVFQTHPAAIPVWETRVIPAASSSLANDKTNLVLSGESV